MKKWLTRFCLCTLAFLIGVGAGIMMNALTVFAGVRVDGYDLGGLSRAELDKWMQSKAREVSKDSLTFYYEDIKYRLEPDALKYSFDVEGTADAVWRYGREGALWHRVKAVYLARNKGYDVPVKLQFDEGKLHSIVDQWAKKIDRPAKNASLSLDSGKIVPEQIGRRLDIEKNEQQILTVLREHKNQVPLIVEEVHPYISSADIEKSGVTDLLGIYTTYFNADDGNRTSNIRVAAKKINGTLLQPGAVFSYNNIVGPRDIKHGFKEALEIVDGEFVPGIGGGVCQVSSTLYNAVLYAGLKIVERTNHSKPLSYVPVGRDATVAYGHLDLRFANSSGAPIVVLAEVQGNQLKMGLFGKDTMTETIQIVVIDQKEIPPGVTKKDDPTIFVGKTKEEQPGLPGYEATALRVWLLNGKEVRREVLSKDKYLPTNSVIRVGTKPQPAPVNLPPAATTMALPHNNEGRKEAKKLELEKQEFKKQEITMPEEKNPSQ
jgi:vancomycin resistance protein YoaR